MARWIINERLQEIRALHDTVRQEISVLYRPVIILVGYHVCAFIGVHTKIKDFCHTKACKRITPYGVASGRALLTPDKLPVIEARGHQFSVVIEVEEFVASAMLLLSGKVGQLVVAVEMHLESLATNACAFEQAFLDIGAASGSQEGREPIEAGEHFRRPGIGLY